jgi:hypothetical protein
VPAKSVIGKLPSGPAQRSEFTGNPVYRDRLSVYRNTSIAGAPI